MQSYEFQFPWINSIFQIIQKRFLFLKTKDLPQISDENVLTSTLYSMSFALATPELGFSAYLILLLSTVIWLGAPAYFLFKSDKGQKSAFNKN